MVVLFETIFGSHLYGTNTSYSDEDRKGIFQADLKDIVLRKDAKTIINTTKSSSAGRRNTSEDVDIEYKELREYIREAIEGQTYALDMLFSPKESWIISSPEWEFIHTNYKKLLSKDVQPYIGYCRHQAGKYGLKGSRLGEVIRVLDWLKSKPQKSKIRDVVSDLELTEFVKLTSTTANRKSELEGERQIVYEHLEVIGKKYSLDSFVQEAVRSLQAMHDTYGERAVLAMNNEGVDWKALSHAVRICYQLKELAETHYIKFPLKEAEFLKEVKAGKYSWEYMNDLISKEIDEAVIAIESSTLPEKADKEFWDEWLVSCYLK